MSSVYYSVYILYCHNGALYTGYTNNIQRRYDEHRQGTAKCKFTRSFKPVGIAQYWQIRDKKSIAMKIEHLIKKMSRKEKEMLILHPEYLEQLLEYHVDMSYCITPFLCKLVS
jgi:putative endonuclease